MGVDGLRVLPCLRKPEHPAELLSSQAFEEFVEVLRQKFDFVVLDSPPVLAVSDPAATAPAADGVILVTRLSKRTRRKVRGESGHAGAGRGRTWWGWSSTGSSPAGEYTRGGRERLLLRRRVRRRFLRLRRQAGGMYSEERKGPRRDRAEPADRKLVAVTGPRVNGHAP